MTIKEFIPFSRKAKGPWYLVKPCCSHAGAGAMARANGAAEVAGKALAHHQNSRRTYVRHTGLRAKVSKQTTVNRENVHTVCTDVLVTRRAGALRYDDPAASASRRRQGLKLPQTHTRRAAVWGGGAGRARSWVALARWRCSVAILAPNSTYIYLTVT